MNVVLVGLIQLINFIKDHKKSFGFATSAVIVAVVGLSTVSVDGNHQAIASGQQVVTSSGELAPLTKVSPTNASREKAAARAADNPAASSKSTTPGTTASPTSKSGSQPAAASGSVTSEKAQAAGSGSVQTDPSAPAATDQAGKAAPGFSVSFDDSATYKDTADNTIVGTYAITLDSGYSSQLSASVIPVGDGVGCTLAANNSVVMKLDSVLPANYYGCRLSVTDGKTTKTADFLIHHAGGSTAS